MYTRSYVFYTSNTLNIATVFVQKNTINFKMRKNCHEMLDFQQIWSQIILVCKIHSYYGYIGIFPKPTYKLK